MNATTINPTSAPITNVKNRKTCSSRSVIRRRQNPAPVSLVAVVDGVLTGFSLFPPTLGALESCVVAADGGLDFLVVRRVVRFVSSCFAVRFPRAAPHLA